MQIILSDYLKNLLEDPTETPILSMPETRLLFIAIQGHTFAVPLVQVQHILKRSEVRTVAGKIFFNKEPYRELHLRGMKDPPIEPYAYFLLLKEFPYALGCACILNIKTVEQCQLHWQIETGVQRLGAVARLIEPKGYLLDLNLVCNKVA